MFVSDPDGKSTARPRFLSRRFPDAFAPSGPPSGAPGPQGRVPWVDVAKGITILLVVVFHAQIYLAHKGLGLGLYTQINTVLQPVRMPLFFAVSGLLAVSLIRQDWGLVLRNRVGLFLALFILWSAIHIAAFKYLLWHPLFAFQEPIGWEVMQGLIRPRTSIWFIWALAFYILFTKSLQSRPAVAAGLSLALGILGASGLPMAYGFALLQQKLLMYLPFFVLPALYGRGALTWIAAHPLPLLAIGAVLSAASVLAAAAFPLEGVARYLSAGTAEVLRAFGGLCAGLAGAVYLARWRPLARILSYFGKRTLAIYLSHILFLSVAVSLLARWEPPGALFYGLPLAVSVAVVSSLGLARALQMTGQTWLLYPTPPAPLRWLSPRFS